MSNTSQCELNQETPGSSDTYEENSFETILSKNATVLMEVPYSDYVRLVKLIDRDEDLRRRSREKSSTAKVHRKQLVNKIQYKIVSATKIPQSRIC